MKNKYEIATQELELNIKHQNIKCRNMSVIGYYWDENIYICRIFIELNLGKQNLGLKNIFTKTKCNGVKQ